MNKNVPPRSLKVRMVSMLCLPVLAAGLVFLAGSASAQTTYYWDGNGATTGAGTNTNNNGNWGGASASAFWNTVAAGTGATTAATITNADTVVFTAFDGTAANSPTGVYTVTLGAAQSVAGLVIGDASSNGNDGTLTLTGTGSPGLMIGGGGVTLNGSNGDPTFNANLGTITLAFDQTWTVNNLHALKTNTAIAGNASTGNTRVWTLGYISTYQNIYSGVISNGSGGGTLALTVNNVNAAGTGTGGGQQFISGTANTYTGKTTVARGILQVALLANAGTNSSLGAATGTDGVIDLGSGANTATLQYIGSTASSTNRVLNLAGTTGGITLLNSSTTANTVSFTGGVTNAGGGAKTLTLRGSNTGNNTVGAISDAADLSKTSIVKTDTGTWVLIGNNTFTGGLSLTSGTLILSASGALGADVSGNNIVVNGGNLQFNADTGFTNTNRSITINSGGIGIGVGGVLPTYIDATVNGVVLGLNLVGDAGITALSGKSFLGSFTGGTFTGSSLTAGDSSTYRLGGGGGTIVIQNNVLVGANNLLVGSTGGGAVTLSGGNTYTGTTTVQNGTLNVSKINSVVGGSSSSSLGAAPTTADNGTIVLGSGTNAVAFNYTGSGETTDRILNLAGTTGAVTLGNSGTGAVVYTSAPTFTGAGSKTLTLGNTGDTFGGSIGGIVDNSVANKTSVTKQGATNSTWNLTGTTGVTSSNTYTGTTMITGGVLAVTGTGTGTDPLANSYLNLNGSTGHLAVLQGKGVIARTLSGTAAATNFSWTGFGGFAAQDGTLTVTANGGTGLTWGSGNFMGNGADPLVFGSTTANNQVVLTNDINLNTLDAYNRIIYVEKGLGGDSAKLSGVISPGTGLTGIAKQGAGTLILSGNNTYTGTTLVTAGKLLINGDQTVANAAVTVSAAATLGGAGIVGGATTVNSGAFLTPGATETGTGVLTFNAGLVMNGTTTLQVLSAGARGTAYDAINIASGTFTGTGALVINFSSMLGDATSLDLFGGAAFSALPTFSSVAATGVYSGTFTLSGGVYTLVNGAQTLTLSAATGDLLVTGGAAVPEPATYAVLAGGAVLAGVGFMRRRKTM